jgi:hypothetical protein
MLFQTTKSLSIFKEEALVRVTFGGASFDEVAAICTKPTALAIIEGIKMTALL